MFYSAADEYKNMILGTERIEQFLSDLKINYRKLKYIHIAGTNGKGSTAKILSEILIASNYKTGLYTSPHIIDITERIQINSVRIKKEEFNILDKQYKKSAKKYNLTFFEYITALAFIYFAEKNTDIVVLETGLGGRFDATNIITPLVSIITTVSLDHTEILGKTLNKIAFEKAGIIKNKIPVVCGKMSDTAFNVINKIAEQKQADIYRFKKDFDAVSVKKYNWQNLYQTVHYDGKIFKAKINLGLLGRQQCYNLAVALFACEILSKKIKINFDKIDDVLQNLKYPSRFDIKKIKIKNKIFKLIIDGAHNKQAVNNFLSLYKKSPFYKEENNLLFAVMEEKNYKEIIKKLSSAFNNVFVVDIQNKRELKPELIKKEFCKYKCKKVDIVKNLDNLFDKLKSNKTLVVLGSFYLAGYIIKYLKERKCLTII